MKSIVILDWFSTYILHIINKIYAKNHEYPSDAELLFWDKYRKTDKNGFSFVRHDVQMALDFLAQCGYIEDANRPIPTQRGRFYWFYVLQFLIIRFLIPMVISILTTLIVLWLKGLLCLPL